MTFYQRRSYDQQYFKTKILVCVITAITVLLCVKQNIWAYDNGAYTVTRTTSYVNPETGQTEDGGSNIALGESMCSSIVDSKALLEVIDGRTYVTLGFGLMSNISDVTIAVQNTSGGSYQNVVTTVTGSCSRDGDTCNHYRFEVSSPELYIRTTFYVAPMGRNVTFFIKLNMSSMTAGTGGFVSEMIPDKGITADTEEIVDTSVEAQQSVSNATDVGEEGTMHGLTENVSDSNFEDKETSEQEVNNTLTSELENRSDESINVEQLLADADGLHVHRNNNINNGQDNRQENATKQNQSTIALVVSMIILLVLLCLVIRIRIKMYMRSSKEKMK